MLFGLARDDKPVNDIVNIGGGQPMSMNELIQISELISSSKLKLIVNDSNPGDSKLTIADVCLQQKLVGITPTTKLEVGILKTYQWFSSMEISDIAKWCK